MTSMRALGRCEELVTRLGVLYFYDVIACTRCEELATRVGLVFFMTSLRAIGVRIRPSGLVWFFYDVMALGWPRKWLLYSRRNL
jgi:hypothetical protein